MREPQTAGQLGHGTKAGDVAGIGTTGGGREFCQKKTPPPGPKKPGRKRRRGRRSWTRGALGQVVHQATRPEPSAQDRARNRGQGAQSGEITVPTDRCRLGFVFRSGSQVLPIDRSPTASGSRTVSPGGLHPPQDRFDPLAIGRCICFR